MTFNGAKHGFNFGIQQRFSLFGLLQNLRYQALKPSCSLAV
jgi:hypothetical protein